MVSVDLAQKLYNLEGKEVLLFSREEGETLGSALIVIIELKKKDEQQKLDDIRELGLLALKIAIATKDKTEIELEPKDILFLQQSILNFKIPNAQGKPEGLPQAVIYQMCEMLEGKKNPFAQIRGKNEETEGTGV